VQEAVRTVEGGVMDIKKQAEMVKETMEQLPEWLGGKGGGK
jgi:hypothetical protein